MRMNEMNINNSTEEEIEEKSRPRPRCCDGTRCISSSVPLRRMEKRVVAECQSCSYNIDASSQQKSTTTNNKRQKRQCQKSLIDRDEIDHGSIVDDVNDTKMTASVAPTPTPTATEVKDEMQRGEEGQNKQDRSIILTAIVAAAAADKSLVHDEDCNTTDNHDAYTFSINSNKTNSSNQKGTTTPASNDNNDINNDDKETKRREWFLALYKCVRRTSHHNNSGGGKQTTTTSDDENTVMDILSRFHDFFSHQYEKQIMTCYNDVNNDFSDDPKRTTTTMLQHSSSNLPIHDEFDKLEEENSNDDEVTLAEAVILPSATAAAAEQVRYRHQKYYQTAKQENEFFLYCFHHALAVAASKGYLRVVIFLINVVKIDPSKTATPFGPSALIQACHFGHYDVAHYLLQLENVDVNSRNHKFTNALMRAAQEGHEDIVRLLLRHHANVNSTNVEEMTPLMLASQRGHASIVKRLIKAGAKMDAKTEKDATALMLAVKRCHLNVVKVLLAAGAELMHRDFRGNTARDMARKRRVGIMELYLTAEGQIHLMRLRALEERSQMFVIMWKLLQQERAFVPACMCLQCDLYPFGVPIHIIWGAHSTCKRTMACDHGLNMNRQTRSSRAVVRAMTLPEPLLRHIAGYVPEPHIFWHRLDILKDRCHVDPDSTVRETLDLIEDILFEGGFTKACDIVKVAPPVKTVASWAEWESVKGSRSRTSRFFEERLLNRNGGREGEPFCRKSFSARIPENYLRVLDRAPEALFHTLCNPPYSIKSQLLSQLKLISDVESVVRRMKGVHFESNVGLNLLSLASELLSWWTSRNTGAICC